jgi:MoaA/NifB/PqqE/SkfB family radical SAM enzyme
MTARRYIVVEHGQLKLTDGPGYHSVFDRVSGFHARWGDTTDEDPQLAPGPEILDIEIATACDGVAGAPCRFCYKSNTRRGVQMSFETYKDLFARLPPTTTQIAFGIGNLYGHEDMWQIFQHTRDNGVVPNVTINGWQLTDELADRLVAVMGAIAVSRYTPKDTCYDAVKKLTDRGMRNVNIHQLVSADTHASCMELLEDMATDPRLAKLNATVFLMLKPKGRGPSLRPIARDQYAELVQTALSRRLRIGVDSCSVPSFLSVTEGHPYRPWLVQSTDPCESGLFSLYIDVHGNAWPCSFGEGRDDLEPVNVLEADDFIEDVWNGPEISRWRERLCGNCRSCPLWKLDLTGEER